MEKMEKSQIINTYLQCSICKNELIQKTKTQIECKTGHKFTIDENVLILETKYKINPIYRWGPELRNPEENLKLDKSMSMKAKEKSRIREMRMIKYIIKNSEHRNSTMLDIATGRGLLVRELINYLSNSILFLSDISTDVLVGTYKLIAPKEKNNVIIPIQSSATRLPFKDNSIQFILSYGPNNVRETEKAFKDMYRVLTKGGYLITALALMEENSPSHKWSLKNETVGNFDLIDKWQSSVEKIGYKIKKTTKLFDGPVEKIPLDLLPRTEGERFQDIGVTLIKP